jgi:hypothetical protein
MTPTCPKGDEGKVIAAGHAGGLHCACEFYTHTPGLTTDGSDDTDCIRNEE